MEGRIPHNIRCSLLTIFTSISNRYWLSTRFPFSSIIKHSFLNILIFTRSISRKDIFVITSNGVISYSFLISPTRKSFSFIISIYINIPLFHTFLEVSHICRCSSFIFQSPTNTFIHSKLFRSASNLCTCIFPIAILFNIS